MLKLTFSHDQDQDQPDLGKLLEDIARVREELDAIATQLKRGRESVSIKIQHEQERIPTIATVT